MDTSMKWPAMAMPAWVNRIIDYTDKCLDLQAIDHYNNK